MILFDVLTPVGVLLKTKIQKISVESVDGFRTLLPKHTDYVSALKTGIISYWNETNTVGYIACNEGILTKKGNHIRLATRLGILGSNIDELTHLIETDFKKMEEARKETNKAMTQMEISLAQGLLKLNREQKNGSF
ncbi:MAG: hypothetical protein IKJ28_01075 [Alphaproteobacteria bacterium]|nr:hypothetical protein [Alphaproteobacteria bacterium]